MTDLGWITAGVPLAVAIALLVVPGALALAPLRMGWTARAALAGPISVAVIGVAGIVAAFVGVPFSIWPVLVVAAALALVAWVARRGGLRLPSEPGRVWPLALTWVLASAVIAVIAFAAVPTPEAVSQTYDNVFHLSAIAAVLEGRDASSLTLRTLIETGDSFSFYPSGWHSLVALTVQVSGAGIPVAVNAAWLAVAAVVWLPGAAWLAQVCIPRSSRTAALVALPLGAAFAAMPYALLTWGTLYPTYLATALLPAAIAVPVLGWRGVRAAREGARHAVVWWSLVATALVAGAVAFGQPRVLVTWALLLAVPVMGVLAAAARRAWRAGGAERTRLLWLTAMAAVGTILLAAVGFWYLVTRLGLFERPLDDRLGGPQAQAVQSLGDGVWQVLAQSWLTGVGGTPTWPAPLLAASVLVGLVVAWRAPRARWLVGSYLIVAVLYVLAAGSDDVVTKLVTALWYKDKYRLSSALVVVAVVLATLGVMAVARWIGRRARAHAAVAVGLAWLVAGSSALSLGATGVTDAVGYVFRMPDRAVDEVISSRQIAFFEQLDAVVPEGQRVVGDPWDGSAWTQAFGGPEPVFPHVNGQWDADRQTIAWHLADIETDPRVCAALDRLKVRYVTYSPRAFGGGDPAGNHFPGPHAAVEAGLFTLVATDGETDLYRIDQCGPLEHAPAS